MKNTNALILILISIGLFYTFIDPQYDKVKALQTEAAEYENVLDNATLIAATRDDLLLDYREIPIAELEKLEKVLPGHVDTVSLAKDFDSIASRYGMTIRRVEVNDDQNTNNATIVMPDAGSSYEKVSITFAALASYPNFKRFLEDIERSLRIIDVRNLSFRSTATGLYEYQVTIDTYWLK